MTTSARRERLYCYLPLATPGGGVIEGLLCHDWEIAKGEPTAFAPYRKCCQDPRNWRGDGEGRPFVGAPEYRERGFVAVRDCACGVCGTRVNGHEWLREGAGQ